MGKKALEEEARSLAADTRLHGYRTQNGGHPE